MWDPTYDIPHTNTWLESVEDLWNLRPAYYRLHAFNSQQRETSREPILNRDTGFVAKGKALDLRIKRFWVPSRIDEKWTKNFFPKHFHTLSQTCWWGKVFSDLEYDQHFCHRWVFITVWISDIWSTPSTCILAGCFNWSCTTIIFYKSMYPVRRRGVLLPHFPST